MRTDRHFELVVVRHGAAEGRRAYTLSGSAGTSRPLTESGRASMRQMAAGFARMVPHIGVLATSPLARAMETAGILAGAYRGLVVETVTALEPDAPKHALVDWLVERRTHGTVVVVGHEPHLGALVGWFLTGVPRQILQLDQGGACSLRFSEMVSPGRATLAWSMSAAQMGMVSAPGIGDVDRLGLSWKPESSGPHDMVLPV